MLLAINVSRLANNAVTPVGGAKVDIWQASAGGKYSGYAAEGTAGHTYLRGNQLTNAHGTATFTTYYAGWYSGRTPHTHFRVRLPSGTTVTYNFVSQLFYNDTVSDQVYAAVAAYGTRGTRNATDGIYTGASQGNGATVARGVGAYTPLLRTSRVGYNVLT